MEAVSDFFGILGTILLLAGIIIFEEYLIYIGCLLVFLSGLIDFAYYMGTFPW